MHILIENEETSEYLVTTGKWSKKPEAGKHFRASDEAVKVARREAIEKFTIVGHIPETNQFVNLDHGRGKGTAAMGGEEVNSEQSQARGEGLVIGE